MMLENEEKGLLNDGLVTIKEAASFFNISRSQVYNYIDRGWLPTVKIARLRRIPRQAMLKLAADHLVGSTDY